MILLMGSGIGITVILEVQIYVAQYRETFGMTFQILPLDESRHKNSNIPCLYWFECVPAKKPSIFTRSEVRREFLWEKIC